MYEKIHKTFITLKVVKNENKRFMWKLQNFEMISRNPREA